MSLRRLRPAVLRPCGSRVRRVIALVVLVSLNFHPLTTDTGHKALMPGVIWAIIAQERLHPHPFVEFVGHSAQAPGSSDLVVTADFGVRRCAGVPTRAVVVLISGSLSDDSRDSWDGCTNGEWQP